MPSSPRAKQCVRLIVTIGVILIVILLHKRVLSPPTFPQQDESRVQRTLDLSSSATFSTVPSSPTTTTVSGITVQINPRTGKLLPPTNQQKQALAAAFRQQFSQLSPHAAFAHGNGMLSIVVGQSQLNFSVARVNPKGEVEVSCLTGVEETAAQLEESIPYLPAIPLPKEE
jgi:hypothetical protein